jgi:hypothetical protein
MRRHLFIFRPPSLLPPQVVPSIARIRTASGTQQRSLAGDAIRIIKLGARPTFFVEDAAHTCFFDAMAAALNKDVSVLECGNSSNVKSLYSLSSTWTNKPREAYAGGLSR